MNKPESLRAHLLAHSAHLRRNPDTLLIFIDDGKLNTQLQSSLNFSYQYNLKLIVTDFAEHPNALIAPLLSWLRHNQIDLKQEAVTFDADIIDHERIDLELVIPLDESVLVEQGDQGQFDITHLTEPAPDFTRDVPDPLDELFPISGQNRG